jgi:hypothetical protein
MKSAILSNQRLINEIDSIRDNFIQSRPHMAMSVFKSTRKHGDRRTNKYDNIVDRPIFKDDRGAGSPAFQSHPLGYQPPGGSTLHPDPLFSGVVDRPVPKGGAMLKRNMPLTGEDSSDDEGAGYLNGYSSSDDEDDYDDGAGLVDDVKETYHKLSKKSHEAIEKLRPYGKEILKKLSTPEAMKIGSAGLTVLLLAVASSYVPASVGKAILPAITAKAMHLAQAVSEGAMSMVTAKKELKKVVDEASESTEKPYVPKNVDVAQEENPFSEQYKPKKAIRKPYEYGKESEEEEETKSVDGKEELATGLRRMGKTKKPKGGKINKIVGTKRGERVRGDIVAELMKKHGMKLGEASKYVKTHGLY